MSADDECHGADREVIVAGNSTAHPGINRHIPEQGNACPSHMPKLLDVHSPGDPIGCGSGRGNVLIVAGQRFLEPARKPERPKGKNAFRIRDVV